MNYQGRSIRRTAQVARSQLALRLGLAIYAGLCSAVALRCVILILGFPESVWSVGAILAVSWPIVFPLTLAPAANRTIIGSASLADFTAALLLLAFSLLFLSRKSRA